MAYSYNEVAGTGSPQLIAVPEYVDQAHIKVRIDGVDTTSFTWINANQIQVTAPAASTVRVYRQTSPGARVVDYVDGQSLTEAVLDADSKQAFFLAQEQLDSTAEALEVYGSLESALADMEVKRANTAASAAAASTSATNAANSASAASTSATNAANSASAASTSETNAAGSASSAAAYVAAINAKVQMAAVVRFSGGSWFLQNDSGHAPMGVASVSVLDPGYGKRLRIGYTTAVGKVGTLILQPDNVLAKMGFLASGGEVGTTAADFELLRRVNIKGQVFWDGSTWQHQYTDSNFPVTVTDLGGGAVRINHPKVYDSLMVPLVVQRDGFYAPRIGTFTDTYFDVKFPVGSPDTACGALFMRTGIDTVDPTDGYSNADGNFWLHGVQHA